MHDFNQKYKSKYNSIQNYSEDRLNFANQINSLGYRKELKFSSFEAKMRVLYGVIIIVTILTSKPKIHLILLDNMDFSGAFVFWVMYVPYYILQILMFFLTFLIINKITRIMEQRKEGVSKYIFWGGRFVIPYVIIRFIGPVIYLTILKNFIGNYVDFPFDDLIFITDTSYYLHIFLDCLFAFCFILETLFGIYYSKVSKKYYDLASGVMLARAKVDEILRSSISSILYGIRDYAYYVYETEINTDDEQQTPFTYSIKNSEYNVKFEEGYRFIKSILGNVPCYPNTLGARIEGYSKGYNGEKKLSRALEMSFCKFFENVVIKSGDGNDEKVEIDAIVVGDNKLLLIESKDYGGEKITFDNSGFLYRTFKGKKDEIITKKENVVNQINHHNFVLKTAISPDIKIENYIIMTDPSTIVEEKRTDVFNLNVKSVDILPNVISSSAGTPTDEFYQYVEKALAENRGVERTYVHADLEKVQEKAYELFCDQKNLAKPYMEYFSDERNSINWYNEKICSCIRSLEDDSTYTDVVRENAIEYCKAFPFTLDEEFVEQITNKYNFYKDLFESLNYDV